MKTLRTKFPTIFKVLGATQQAQDLKLLGDQIADKYLVTVKLAAEDDDVWIDNLEALKQGEGQKFMKEFTDAADKFQNVDLWLNAVPYEHNKMKPKELALWYEMFNFKVHERTDWTDGYVMVRKPRPGVTSPAPRT